MKAKTKARKRVRSAPALRGGPRSFAAYVCGPHNLPVAQRPLAIWPKRS